MQNTAFILNSAKSGTRNYFQRSTSAAPLAVFRIVFSLMLLGGMIRFWTKGWIGELYIRPSFFFSYFGFEWVKPLGDYTYVLFAVCGVACVMVALGLFYRIACLFLFTSFTYIELMDKATYLNHYYFVSLVCFVLIFLPANAIFSLDNLRKKKSYAKVPSYTVDILKVMMGIVYMYAGLAKVNSDWLLEAQPLLTWLPAKNDVPVIGQFFNYAWVAYVFSWFACIYDLTIPIWLSWRKSRNSAFVFVIVFHVLTAVLFPIGMFPYIMIVSALIFFPASLHDKIIVAARSFFRIRKPVSGAAGTFAYPKTYGRIIKVGMLVFIAFQLLVPLRYLLYPGEVLWTEEGYRFSWRVMLMEKNGYSQFTVYDPQTNRKVVIENSDYLSRLQEKQMSFQPDMILEFAHHLADRYSEKGWKKPAVFVESYVTINGRPSRLFIDPKANLAEVNRSFNHKSWVLSFDNEIHGF